MITTCIATVSAEETPCFFTLHPHYLLCAMHLFNVRVNRKLILGLLC